MLQRADEPGELLGYWTSRYGRNPPEPAKRGLTDAAFRMIPLLEAGRHARRPWEGGAPGL
ncbi:hypothetical protein ACFY41_20945 [Streptomyces syringium]|uniref:hypothetical protein n=1 Tax=Streptomyces syringium TaxID=76729 RepID=UPI003676D834